LYNIFSHLVYAAESSDVFGVIIDGKKVFWDNKILTVYESNILDKAERKAEEIKSIFRIED